MEMETLYGADLFVFLRPNKRRKSELTMEENVTRKNNSTRIMFLDNIIENTNTKAGFILNKTIPKDSSLEGVYEEFIILSPVLKTYSGLLNIYSGEENNLFFARNILVPVTCTAKSVQR